MNNFDFIALHDMYDFENMKKKFPPGTFIFSNWEFELAKNEDYNVYPRLVIGWYRDRESDSINEIDHWYFLVLENSSIKRYSGFHLLSMKTIDEF